jgi:3-hydroxyisobutyrate dehydrogenase-like beta-hydroxyacid dehydrogenase
MRVAVVGLGRMGTGIAQRLEQADHQLSVWNRSPDPVKPFTERGVRALEHPADAWKHAELVITMVTDDDAVQAVTLGEHGVLEAGEDRASEAAGRGVLVDMSTISARTSAAIAAHCETSRVAYLRAPVSGNPTVVAAGNLGIIVSGPRAEFERVADALADIGPNLFYVGGADESRIVKLALNLMLGGTTQLLAEALVLGRKHGIDRAKLLEVISGSAIGSPYVSYKTDALLADDYDSTFTASQLHKDLGLALEAGHDAGVPLALTAATQQLVEGCIGQGMGDLDLSALLPRLEREAGVHKD